MANLPLYVTPGVTGGFASTGDGSMTFGTTSVTVTPGTTWHPTPYYVPSSPTTPSITPAVTHDLAVKFEALQKQLLDLTLLCEAMWAEIEELRGKRSNG